MRAWAVGGLSGVALQLTGNAFDHWWIAAVVLGLLALLLRRHTAGHLLAAMLVGWGWAAGYAASQQVAPLPEHLAGKDLAVDGWVASLPYREGRALRFDFLVRPSGEWPAAETVVRLRWYTADRSLEAGQPLRLTLRLKPPRPGARPRVSASGYLREPPRRADGEAPRYPLLRLRQQISSAAHEALDGRPLAPLVAGIAVGDRQGLAVDAWGVLSATGTSHLMAISGLHVGLVAAMAFSAARVAVALIPWCRRRCAPIDAGAGLALVAAVGYAALAGFTVPTQRALVMIGLVALAVLARRAIRADRALAAALLLVLAIDPRAAASAGFWMSFLLVAALLLIGLHGRGGSPLWLWIRVQCAVTVAAMPLALAVFGQLPWAALPANLIAIPWFAVFIVPPALLAALASALGADAGWLWRLAAAGWEPLWGYLQWLAPLGAGLPAPPPAPMWAVVLAAAGVAVVLAPIGWSRRGLGALLLLPLLAPRVELPPPGGFVLQVLDVGQGLAVTVRTATRALVYDTGPRYLGGRDAGSAVVVPALRRQGVQRLDALVLSHDDGDHVGGTRSLLEAVPTTVTWVPDPIALPAPDARACRAGEGWRWDDVEFRFLHPDSGRGASDGASCVLQVVAAGGSVLLTGDLDAAGEQALARTGATGLRSEVVLVPRHGGRGALGSALLRQVDPAVALVASGYRNRHGYPHADTRARLAAAGVVLLDTAVHGTLMVRASAQGLTVAAERASGCEFAGTHPRGQIAIMAAGRNLPRGEHCD